MFERKKLALATRTARIHRARKTLPIMDYDFESSGDLDDELSELNDEASYICDSCGEEIVVPIDHSEGSHQQYVEDCPVCCCPNVIHVQYDEDGRPDVSSHAE